MVILPEDKSIISFLNDKEARELLLALVSDEEPQDISDKAMMVYTVINNRNRRISKNKSEAGKQGGAPKGNQNAKKQTDNTETSNSAEKQPKQADGEKTNKTTHRTDTDTNNPPNPPRGKGDKSELKSVYDSFTFSSALKKAVDLWIKHKKEIKKEYKPTGLKAVLKKISEQAAEHGEKAVIDLINLSVSNNWQGIAWDKLANARDRPQTDNTYAGYKNLGDITYD